MSRTFEILERVQQDHELFGVPPVTKAAPITGKSPNVRAPIADPNAFAREEVLKLVQSLFFGTTRMGHGGPRVVVFCGIDEADGSSLLCARVGRSLAEQVQSQVCVVEANTRLPTTRPMFDMPQFDSSSLSVDGTKEKFLRVTNNLWVASCDSQVADGDAPALGQFRAIIKERGLEFAHVIVNTPPIGLYHDAALLAQMADGIVLVLEANSTRRVAARKAKLALENGDVKVLGTVLNNRTFPIPEKTYRLL